MTIKPCLIVPLSNGEDARQILIGLHALDRKHAPKRIGNELALPILDGVDLDNITFGYRLERIEVDEAPPSINPLTRLLNAILPMLNTKQELIQSIPTKWERLDDLILFPKDAFQGQEWASILNKQPGFFTLVAEALNANRIGRQQPIADDQMRTSQVEMLLGENGWVEVKDNGLIYGFDATKVMYSSGNVTERHRMATMPAEDDIVIDAYAGIGYYTMQLLVHAKVEHVHACEINPNSIKALEWSAKENQVQSRLTLHPGDNQITLKKLQGLADRILLGYLPSSEETWELAVRALKETGGTLHIHMNVEEERIESWCKETVLQCLQYAKDVGRDWDIVSQHVEKVKWYAPRIRHVVLDASFSSRSSAS